MSPEQLAAYKARTEQLASALGIGMEASALIVELHDLASAFRQVAEALQAPRRYVMRQVSDPLSDAEPRYIFEPEPDTMHDA